MRKSIEGLCISGTFEQVFFRETRMDGKGLCIASLAVLSAGGTTFGTSFERTVHCFGREFRVLNCYDQKSFVSVSATKLESFLFRIKDVPALKLRVPALTSRVCALSYWFSGYLL
ncbi:hypothetical protein Tco_0588734 [Tanacetum coccineum]